VQNVEKHQVKCDNKKLWDYCEEITTTSRRLYNAAQFAQRQSLLYGGGVLSQGRLDSMFKNHTDYKSMPAKVAQLVFKQNFDAWDSYLKALSEYQLEPKKFTGKPKEPGYIHNRNNLVKFNYQAVGKVEFKKGFIVPSMSPIKIPVKPGLKFAELSEVRIIPKTGCFVVEIVYSVAEKQGLFCSLNPNLAAAIDIGLDNLATIVFSDPTIRPIILNGKPIKSENQFYNKQMAKFRGFLPLNIATSTRIQNIVRNRNNFVDNYLHQSAKLIVDELVKLGVTEVAIGKNEQWKTKLNLSQRVNQHFTLIPHAGFIEILTYKLEKVGIIVKVGEESYTSKASLIDWDTIPTFDLNNHVNLATGENPRGKVHRKHEFSGKRIKRALYVSKDGFKIHADVNGAFNIGRKVIPNLFDCLQSMISRDRGCLVVHPRRITPLFCRVNDKNGVA
jgi:putative transposase